MTSLFSGCRCRTAAGLNRWTFRTDVVVPVAPAIAHAVGVFIPTNPSETMDPKNENASDCGTIVLPGATARAVSAGRAQAELIEVLARLVLASMERNETGDPRLEEGQGRERGGTKPKRRTATASGAPGVPPNADRPDLQQHREAGAVEEPLHVR
jgi:hypothetical protein